MKSSNKVYGCKPLFRPGRLAIAIGLASLAHSLNAADTRIGPIAVEADAEQGPMRGTATVDEKTLRKLRAVTSDTASLLRDVPGVSLYGAGGVSSLPAIRGLADDRLRIKVDGMDLIATCPNHMNPPLSYVDPSNVGTLRVFAGITPVSVGGDSIGGTIIAETVAPTFATAAEQSLSQGEVGAFYRSNNSAVGGNLGATYATQTFNINYSGSWSQADNYTAGGDFKTTTETGRPGHTLPLDEVGSTAYETRNHALNLALKAGDDLFELKLGYQDMPYQLYPNQRMDMLDNEQKRINLGWTGGFDWGALEARVYHEQVDHFMDFGEDKRFWYGSNSQPPVAPEIGTPCDPIRFHGDPLGTCAAGMPMYSESETLGLNLKADVDLSEQDLLRLGAEYQRYRLDDYWTASGGGMGPGTFHNINDGERDRMALFTEWESQLDARWLTLLGVRYERVDTDAGEVQGYAPRSGPPTFQVEDSAAFNASDRSRTDHNVDLTALARYSHDASLDIEFGVARKVRSPNLYERYTWSTWAMAAVMNNFVGDGNGYVGDIDLEPEKAHTASITFDWHAPDRSWEFKATPYYTRVSDYIDAIEAPNWSWDTEQFNVLQYANQSARLYGIDLSAKIPLAENAWGAWGLTGIVNYTNGKNRETGDALYNIMPLNGRFTLTHKKGGWDNGVEVVVVDDKDDTSDIRNEIETSGYTLVNLRASHSWKRVRLDFGIENLFDEFYELPTGGAYTGQGTTMSINGIPWGIAVPGMGRSAYAGVTVTF
jgi:iron complex outermembrane receptor protein